MTQTQDMRKIVNVALKTHLLLFSVATVFLVAYDLTNNALFILIVFLLASMNLGVHFWMRRKVKKRDKQLLGILV